MVDNLSTSLTKLADGFRKHYNITKSLTISDMIKLINPDVIMIIDKGKFLVGTNMADHDNLLGGNGGLISGGGYIDYHLYDTNNRSLLHMPRATNLLIRMHLDVISTDGMSFFWGINGLPINNQVYPTVGMVTSDFLLDKSIGVDEHNSIAFNSNGRTTFNPQTSYIELIKK